MQYYNYNPLEHGNGLAGSEEGATNMKRFTICTMILLLFAVLLLLPAETKAFSEGECGDNLHWTLTDDGLLTITGNGRMSDYSSYTDVPWTEKRESIRLVSLPEGMTTIGKNAFFGCVALRKIDLPNTVTFIGSSAFNGCTGISELTFGENLTIIGGGAFSGCSGLTELDFPDTLRIIGSSAFSHCSGLIEVTIPENVTYCGKGSGSTLEYAYSDLEYLYWSNPFAACEKLASFAVAAGNTYFISVDGVLFSADGTRLVAFPCAWTGDYVVPDSVTVVARSAFNGAAIGRLFFPEGIRSFDELQLTDTIKYDAFTGCNEQTELFFLAPKTKADWSRVISNRKLHFEQFRPIDCVAAGPAGNDLTWRFDDKGNLYVIGTGSYITSLEGAKEYRVRNLVISPSVTAMDKDVFGSYSASSWPHLHNVYCQYTLFNAFKDTQHKNRVKEGVLVAPGLVCVTVYDTFSPPDENGYYRTYNSYHVLLGNVHPAIVLVAAYQNGQLSKLFMERPLYASTITTESGYAADVRHIMESDGLDALLEAEKVKVFFLNDAFCPLADPSSGALPEA